MLNIYYQPHNGHFREMAFIQHLLNSFPEAQIIHDRFDVDRKYLDCFVQKVDIISNLRADNFLSNKRRQNCLDLLADCPSQIKIALNPKRIWFDVVVEKDEKIYYWEFHEEQHRKLKDSRYKHIYDANNNEPISVPRYLQRFIRDIWRAKCFRPYTIVWFDWFALNRHQYKPELRESFHELHLSNQFSFHNFLAN